MSSSENKLDEIFSRLDEIEKRIGIQPKKLSDFLEDCHLQKRHTIRPTSVGVPERALSSRCCYAPK